MADISRLFPGGMRVFERGWLSSNNVLLVGADSTALVDSGYATHAEQTLTLVRKALAGRPLDKLVNTHLHSDHCGGNASLQCAYSSLRTWVPAGQADAVARWDSDELTFRPTGQLCTRFHYTDVLAANSHLELGGVRWEVHAAPGHDRHSMILFEPQTRTLLSADALWEHGFGVVFQELEGEEAFSAVRATLQVIEQLGPTVVVPGHGAPFTDVAGSLGRARARLDSFIENPKRHAAHGAKVLLKFKLLELQRVTESQLRAWAEITPYFHLVQVRWFPEQKFEDWLSGLLGELERGGALAREGDSILNR